MRRRAFIRTAAGIFVPAVTGLAQVPLGLGDCAFLGRHRGSGSGEPQTPASILGANLYAFYRSDMGLNFDGSNLIYDNASTPSTKAWLDQSGNGRHLSCASSHKGERLVANINGRDAVRCSSTRTTDMACSSLGGDWNNPYTAYLLIKQVAWANNREIFNMNNNAGLQSATLFQWNSSSLVLLFSGNAGAGNSTTIGVWTVLTLQEVDAGAHSLLNWNKAADALSTTGGRSHHIIEIGTGANGFYCDVDFAAIIISNAADSRTDRLKVIDWLSWYGNLGL